ncbi:MAG: sigma-70 family RNA polymerase sigma factor [Clostridiales bacterium]|nr:sigma-70 family RNA polymerase sigma factor [Clostridiales bacterium]
MNYENELCEYFGKIFYFSLKKAGNEQDASDLASDICYEIVASLHRGKKPENFDAWLWAVARNRYAKWAKKKYYGAPEQIDIFEYADMLSDDTDVESDVILREDISLIRRELAFVRSDYRKILVAHYIEEKSVSVIAKEFGLPEGTVKTRLQNSRKLLKEGMNMARQFGQRSFNPEDIDFSSSGNQPTGLPWDAIGRKIPRNILCAANNNPSTTEDLSMELGISVPYMEEEVSLLCDAELLKKLDDGKYLTNFFIAPRECQTEIKELCNRFAEQNAHAIWELGKKALDIAKSNGYESKAVSDMYAQTYFTFLCEQMLLLEQFEVGIYFKFNRKDGGNWGIIGFESGAKSRIKGISFSNNNCTTDKVSAGGFFQNTSGAFGKNIYRCCTPDSAALMTIKALCETGGDISRFSESDANMTSYLVKNGFFKKTDDGKYVPALMVLRYDTLEKVKNGLKELPDYKEISLQYGAVVKSATEILKKYSMPQFEADFDYYVAMLVGARAPMARIIKDDGLCTEDCGQFLAFVY